MWKILVITIVKYTDNVSVSQSVIEFESQEQAVNATEAINKRAFYLSVSTEVIQLW